MGIPEDTVGLAKYIKDKMKEEKSNRISFRFNRMSDAQLRELRKLFKSVKKEPFNYIKFEI